MALQQRKGGKAGLYGDFRADADLHCWAGLGNVLNDRQWDLRGSVWWTQGTGFGRVSGPLTLKL